MKETAEETGLKIYSENEDAPKRVTKNAEALRGRQELKNRKVIFRGTDKFRRVKGWRITKNRCITSRVIA